MAITAMWRVARAPELGTLRLAANQLLQTYSKGLLL
mgnify:CR=1 FL=1